MNAITAQTSWVQLLNCNGNFNTNVHLESEDVVKVNYSSTVIAHRIHIVSFNWRLHMAICGNYEVCSGALVARVGVSSAQLRLCPE